MKFTFFENDHGANFSFTPENVEEAAMLLRLTNNARAEKPQLNFYFAGNNPSCDIWIKKISKNKQKNFITNR